MNNAETNTTDPVVIVGNGPVGQTAALLLARWGIPVVLLDERAERDLVGSKAICQQRDVLDIWESIGAGAQLADEGLTWTTARTFYQDTELFSVTFQDAGRSPFPPFVNISQSRTEEVLDQRIAEQPLIDVRWGHRVVSLHQDDRSVRVDCATSDGMTTVRGSYLVACPGARAHELRAQLGVSFNGDTFDEKFLICDVRTHLPEWQHERRFYFDPSWNPGRQVLIHPCPNSTFRIDWQVPSAYDLDADEQSGGLEKRIRQIIGDREYEVIWQSVYRFHSRVVDRMRVGRALILGDAAHLVAPFGARGLNSGVADAENATWKLAYVLRGWAPDSLLDSFHAERHRAAAENLDVTGATMRFLVPRDDVELTLRRDTLEAARHDAVARKQVDSGRLAEPYWYVDSPLTTADCRGFVPSRPEKGKMPKPGSGVLIPDLPIVVADDPRVTRLRELVRQGITLLVGADLDISAIELGAAGIASPVRVYAVPTLSPELNTVLEANPDEVWVVRPDGHIAAVLIDPDAEAIRHSIDRLLGFTIQVPA